MLQQVIVFLVLAIAMVLFMWGRWRYDLVALLALLALTLVGIIPADQAYLGFAQPAVVTVAAVLIISRALTNAGVVDYLSRLTQRIRGGLIVQLAALTGLVMFLSAFINNVGALSLLMPVAVQIARARGVSPSLLLMPLAFGSLLGGMTTLIGTPPNLLIASFREQADGRPFGMFDFTPVGGGVAVVGALFLCLAGWRLIPKRSAPKSTSELFEIDRYLTEVMVPEKSPSIGRRIRDIMAELKGDILITGLVRGKRRIPVPAGLETLKEDDHLIVEAAPEDIQRLLDAAKLELVGKDQRIEKPLDAEDFSLVEAIVMPDGYLVNRSARSANLRWRFGVNLLAVARQGARLKSGLSTTRFRAGDILLLQGPKDQLPDALGDLGCLPLAQRDLRLGQPRRLLTAIAIFAVAIALTAFGLLRVEVAFCSAAVLLTLLGAVSLKELYESIDWSVIVLLGAMIPVGTALETTGAAALVADQLLRLSTVLAPWAMVGVLLVLSMFLSDIINNAATVVLLAPIGIRVAKALECATDPFLMAIAIGASCAFLTPIGHQSNTLVLNPGGYRFSDYWRVGLPLEVVIVATAVPLLLWAWPLSATAG